jgi:hypothetical protein
MRAERKSVSAPISGHIGGGGLGWHPDSSRAASCHRREPTKSFWNDCGVTRGCKARKVEPLTSVLVECGLLIQVCVETDVQCCMQ